MPGSVKSYLMPFSNVAHLPLEEKFRATRLAGCSLLSLMPLEVERELAAGRSLADIAGMAAGQGVRIARLDPLNTWPRLWRPDNMDEAYIRSVATTPERFFELSEALGCTHMSLNATFPRDAMPLEEVIRHYAAICARAAEHGLLCDLEFIPLWGVPGLDMAWDIVRESGAGNGGLVFDAWHFVRSHSDIELLRRIPGERIHCVQLNDGPLQLPAGVSLKDNCYDRYFPGDGEFPLAAIVRALADIDGLEQVGAEVFSPMLAAMGTEEVAARSRDSVAGVLAACAIPA